MQDISRDILTRASGGDVIAFEEIYSVASGYVYGIAFRITNNREDAEEITQDVFLKIYRNLKGFRFRSSFKTWVYKIAVTTALNVCRKNKKMRKSGADYDIAVKTVPASDETGASINREDNERLVAALLDVLNPEQRACVVLREIEGLSYKEIAETLKININTVRSRLKRARLALITRGKEAIRDEL